jgi:hypothetical protein
LYKRRKRRQIAPNGNFPNPFGDVLAEKAELLEAEAMANEIEVQTWLRSLSAPPPAFKN